MIEASSACDAVEVDAIRADLLDAVNRAVQPTHASQGGSSTRAQLRRQLGSPRCALD